jgi:hypothetical protein
MKSFLEGRPAVSRNGSPLNRGDSQLPSFDRGAMDAPVLARAAAASSPAPAREHGEKKIETVEAGGVVQKIIITCGCGERIEVHCGY